MTYLKGQMLLEKFKHRLVEPMFLLSVICGAMISALTFRLTGNVTGFPAEVGLDSRQFDRYIMLPVQGPIGGSPPPRSFWSPPWAPRVVPITIKQHAINRSVDAGNVAARL